MINFRSIIIFIGNLNYKISQEIIINYNNILMQLSYFIDLVDSIIHIFNCSR